MKQWGKFVVVEHIIAKFVVFAGEQEGFFAWANEHVCENSEDDDPNLLVIYHAGEEDNTPVPGIEETDVGAFTFGQPEEFLLMKLVLCPPPPDSGDTEQKVSLTVKSGDVTLLNQDKTGPPPKLDFSPEEIPSQGQEFWVTANTPSESERDIEICADFIEECEDTVNATAVMVDLDIHHGNNKKDSSGKFVSTVVTDDEEETRGAFTVVNRNDTDADGDPDYKDFNGVLDEVDLMKLIIRKLQPAPKQLLNHPSFEDFVTIEIVEGNDQVALWKDSTKVTKQPPKSPGSNVYEFPLADFDPHLGSKTVWVEATKPSNAFGDITIKLEYKMEDHVVTDIVKATGIWPEVDVREEARPENRVGRDDPRMTGEDALARNSLLVWHDSDNDSAITFEVVKTDIPDGGIMLDNNSPIWIQLEEKTPLPADPLRTVPPRPNADVLPFCECLEKVSQKYPDSDHPKLKPPLKIYSNHRIEPQVIIMTARKKDYFVPDFVVKYGIDYDESGILGDDENEIKGEYGIFGITQWDYQEAIYRYDTTYLPLTLTKLGQALCYRVSHGVWDEPWRKDYRPDKDGACTPAQEAAIHRKEDSCSAPGYDTNLIKDAERPTHNLGVRVTNHTSIPKYVKNADGSGGEYPRQYFDATVTVPVYYWNNKSHASQLVKDSNYLRDWILYQFLFNKTFVEIKSAYGAGTGIKQLTFAVPQDQNINFTPFKTIGLGSANLNPKKHKKQPEITLSVEKVDAETYDILRKVMLHEFSVDDGFDYNYFKPDLAQKTLASVSGSSLQSSFGQEGALPVKPASPKQSDVFQTTGQVPREHIDIDGEHDLIPVHPDLGTIAGFRIRETNGPWSFNNWSVFVICGEDNEKKCEKKWTWFDEKFKYIMFLERKVPF